MQILKFNNSFHLLICFYLNYISMCLLFIFLKNKSYTVKIKVTQCFTEYTQCFTVKKKLHNKNKSYTVFHRVYTVFHSKNKSYTVKKKSYTVSHSKKSETLYVYLV